ncbi:hypothetical protein E2C01_078642 [Portunus trituberculatus]|uniref:Uncharacterized protein n=1 Tax=Portunus trituberculatus TaxID=210409 RepID=A0A5B7IHF8_PORTR|nr:hypothetical protein [Portunus trituberculatus]
MKTRPGTEEINASLRLAHTLVGIRGGRSNWWPHSSPSRQTLSPDNPARKQRKQDKIPYSAAQI